MSSRVHSTIPQRTDNKSNLIKTIVVKRTKIRESTLIGTIMEYYRLLELIKKGLLNDAYESFYLI